MANTPNFKGGKVSICATAQDVDLDQAGFEALTFVEAGKVIEHANIAISTGDSAQNYWGHGVTQHQKGHVDVGGASVMFGYDPDDTGHDAFDTASASRSSFAVKIELDDNPNGVTNTIVYTRGYITYPEYQFGEGEAFFNKTFNTMYNQLPIVVKPTVV